MTRKATETRDVRRRLIKCLTHSLLPGFLAVPGFRDDGWRRSLTGDGLTVSSRRVQACLRESSQDSPSREATATKSSRKVQRSRVREVLLEGCTCTLVVPRLTRIECSGRTRGFGDRLHKRMHRRPPVTRMSSEKKTPAACLHPLARMLRAREGEEGGRRWDGDFCFPETERRMREEYDEK